MSGGETQGLLLLLQARESPGWHGSKSSPPHSTGTLGKSCVCKMSSLFYSNYYMKMILSVAKAAETMPKSLVPWQEMPWCRWHACHSQSTHCPMPGHPLVLPGWRMLLSPLPGKVTGSLQEPPASSTTTNISNFPLEIVSVNILISFGLSRWSEDNTSRADHLSPALDLSKDPTHGTMPSAPPGWSQGMGWQDGQSRGDRALLPLSLCPAAGLGSRAGTHGQGPTGPSYGATTLPWCHGSTTKAGAWLIKASHGRKWPGLLEH